MLTGVVPFDEVSSTRRSEPSGLIFRTATSFAAAFTAMRYRRSDDNCRAPAEPVGLPMPAAPASNGVPAIGVSVPSAWRSKPEIVLCPAVLLLTYTWPVTDPFDAATPEAGPSRRAV